ncbi:MAG: hypothetical protein Q4A28_00955 [Brachymonas sp.]|nr:hypothetical protein [Brachymonas sp.]
MPSPAWRGIAPLAALALWALPAVAASAPVSDIQAADCELPAPALVQQELIAGYTDLAREAQCSKNADYQLLLGQVLNALQRHTEAAERLELALLLRPQHAESRFEFFLALQGMGDTLAAQSLLQELDSQPDLPAPIRLALAQATASPAPSAPLAMQQTGWQKQISLTLGHDNNLLASPVRSQFELTLPGGRVPVTLIEGPRAGMFWRLSGHVRFQSPGPAPGRMWYGALSGSLHQTPGEKRASYAVARGLVENASIQSHGPFAQAYVTAAFNNKGHFYRELGGAIGWDMDLAALGCRLRLGAEGALQQFPSGSNVNSHYQGLQARSLCANWRVEARAGQDSPSHAAHRAGGKQQQTALAVSHWLQRGRNRWQLDYEYEHTRDQNGYSPLLENKRKRRVHKHLLRLEYAHKLPELEIFAGAEAIHRRANLQLFNTRAQTLYLGLRKTW